MTDAIIRQKMNMLGYADWDLTQLQGDASTRQFYRLRHQDHRSAIVMLTPLDQLRSQTQFLTIAAHLRSIGLCAPKLLADEASEGLLILEDLGPDDIATVAANKPSPELSMYQTAIDVLIQLNSKPPPLNLITLTPQVAAEMLDPFFDCYAQQVTDQHRSQITETLSNLLSKHMGTNTALALRDYHAQNLIWRGAKHDTDRIGLIDFQDAFLAPPEYDLVSLLRDARRDVSRTIQNSAMTYFCTQAGADPDETRLRCALLGVQRNLRILGIFARLAKQSKPSYLKLIPRVASYIETDLAHPTLGDLKPLILPHLHPEAV